MATLGILICILAGIIIAAWGAVHIWLIMRLTGKGGSHILPYFIVIAFGIFIFWLGFRHVGINIQ